MEFGKHNLDGIRADINEALAIVAEQHNISFALGNMRYAPDKFTVTLTGLGEANTNPLKRDFLAHAERLGFQPDDYGRAFKCHGKTVILAGAKPNSPKYPMIIQKSDGRRYKVAASELVRI